MNVCKSHSYVCLQKMDAQRIRDFILQHSPHVLVIGSCVPEAEQLKMDIQQISDKIMEITPEFLTRSDTGAKHLDPIRSFSPHSIQMKIKWLIQLKNVTLNRRANLCEPCSVISPWTVTQPSTG